MNLDKRIVLGGLLALIVGTGQSVVAQTQRPEPQAAPSQAPASQAKTKAVTGTADLPSKSEVGTQQAAPSQRPAPEATTSGVEKRKAGEE